MHLTNFYYRQQNNMNGEHGISGSGGSGSGGEGDTTPLQDLAGIYELSRLLKITPQEAATIYQATAIDKNTLSMHGDKFEVKPADHEGGLGNTSNGSGSNEKP